MCLVVCIGWAVLPTCFECETFGYMALRVLADGGLLQYEIDGQDAGLGLPAGSKYHGQHMPGSVSSAKSVHQ